MFLHHSYLSRRSTHDWSSYQWLRNRRPNRHKSRNNLQIVLVLILLIRGNHWQYCRSRPAYTSTGSILPTTDIAKFILTPAGHMVTTLVLLDPKFAIRALLKLGTLYQDHKLPVRLIHIRHALIFFAGDTDMHLAFAVETIVFFAGWTFVVVEALIKGKDGLASRGWAPTCILHMILHIILEHEIIIFLFKIPWQKFMDLLVTDLQPTLFSRTPQRYTFLIDLLLWVLVKTLSMIHVATGKHTQCLSIDLYGADGALYP